MTQADLGPRSVSPRTSLSKGANAISPRSTEWASMWTSRAYLESSMTATLKRNGNTSPMAASFPTSLERFTVSMREIASTPLAAAPIIRKGDERSPTRKNASIIPSRIEWLTASVIMDILRSTRNVPGTAQEAATRDGHQLNVELVGTHSPSPLKGARPAAARTPAGVRRQSPSPALSTCPESSSRERLFLTSNPPSLPSESSFSEWA